MLPRPAFKSKVSSPHSEPFRTLRNVVRKGMVDSQDLGWTFWVDENMSLARHGKARKHVHDAKDIHTV
jgi:hypothetical protein